MEYWKYFHSVKVRKQVIHNQEFDQQVRDVFAALWTASCCCDLGYMSSINQTNTRNGVMLTTTLWIVA
jgi:hypothetical protein